MKKKKKKFTINYTSSTEANAIENEILHSSGSSSQTVLVQTNFYQLVKSFKLYNFVFLSMGYVVEYWDCIVDVFLSLEALCII